MSRIPILCLALLLATVITLQTTTPQNHIIYLAAPTGLTKMKPVDIAAHNQRVLTLEEAVADYERKHGPIRTEDEQHISDDSDCLLGNCNLDYHLFMAKIRVKYFVRNLIG